jgi:hypothetical protein
MKIEMGSEITRTFGKRIEIWKITRIEIHNESLCIFACKDTWFQKHFDNKLKLYYNDELVLKFEKTYDNR